MDSRNSDLRKVLSLNIKNHRKTLDLSQEKLAEKTGISLNMIKDIEGCRTWVSDKTLIKLAHTLKVDIYRLFISSSMYDEDVYKTVVIDLMESLKKIRKNVDVDFGYALSALAAIAGEKEPTDSLKDIAEDEGDLTKNINIDFKDENDLSGDMIENIRHSTEKQGQDSRQIMQAIGQVSNIIDQIKTGSVEMLEGAKEVLREADNLQKLTEEITSGMNDMATGTEQVNRAVVNVNGLTQTNNDGIDLLVKEVSRFKVN